MTVNLCRFTKNSVGLGQNIKIEKSAGKPVIHDNRNFNVRLYQGLKTFKTLSGYPLRVEEQRKKRKGYKRYDKNTIHLPRQESEYELFSGLWRLKCGKSGQERQRETTILLLLRKEK